MNNSKKYFFEICILLIFLSTFFIPVYGFEIDGYNETWTLIVTIDGVFGISGGVVFIFTLLIFSITFFLTHFTSQDRNYLSFINVGIIITLIASAYNQYNYAEMIFSETEVVSSLEIGFYLQLFVVISYVVYCSYVIHYLIKTPEEANDSRPLYELKTTNIASNLDNLDKLKRLFDSGALTQEEYESQKRKILEWNS